MNSMKLYGHIVRAGNQWFAHIPDINFMISLNGPIEPIKQIQTAIRDQLQNGLLTITKSSLTKSAIFYVKAATNREMRQRGLWPNEFRTELIEVSVPVENK